LICFHAANWKARRLYALAAAAILTISVIAGARWYKMSVFSLDPADPAVTLAEVERAVSATFEAPEITATRLAGEIARGGILLFDVREDAEFDQSHIEGAHHILPSMDAEHFAAEYGPGLRGKKVAFYCAAGVRSAMMLNRVKPAITGFAPEALYNLRGGIFRWFAEGHAVAAANGHANSVHPYDEAWGTLLARTLRSGS
jgi:rhodanese-related sulfurtransferase